MSLIDTQEPGDTQYPIDAQQEMAFDPSGPRPSRRGRRIVVAIVGLILAGAACIVMGLAFVQGSWWHHYGYQDLSPESLSRVKVIRDAVDASGQAPEAIKFLEAALDPNADSTAVWLHIVSAQEILEASDDPKLIEAAKELEEIAQTIRRTGPFVPKSTPRPTQALEWPWADQ
jgi:hypothetical protein